MAGISDCRALYKAAENGDLDEITELLDSGVHPDSYTCQDFFDATALHIASYKGHPEVVNALLCKSNSEAKTSLGKTALYLAAEAGHVKVVQVLLDHGCNVDAKSNAGGTPLVMAAQQGHPDVVQLLINEGAVVNFQCKNGHTPLYRALYEDNDDDHLEVARILIQAGADIDILEESMRCTVERLKNERGYQPRNISRQRNPRTQMKQKAKAGGKHQRVKSDHGPNLEKALYKAVEGGKADKVRELLDKVQGPGSYKGINGMTPVHVAAWHGHEECLSLLLQAAGDRRASLKLVMERDDSGSTPLHLASRQGQLGAVHTLLQHGAEACLRLTTGRHHLTPLDLTWNKHPQVYELLSNWGRDPKAKPKLSADDDSDTEYNTASGTISLHGGLQGVATNDMLVTGHPRAWRHRLLFNEDKLDALPLCDDFTIERWTDQERLRELTAFDNMDVYPTLRRGLAIIYNGSRAVGKLRPRHGSHTDVKILSHLFRELGFMVEMYMDLPHENITRVLEDAAKDGLLREHDCLMLVLMGHGRARQGQTQLLADDGSFINIKDLISHFDNLKCPALKGKPKMTFIQCCRGLEEDVGVIDSDSSTSLISEDSCVPMIPITADMFAMYATSEGHKAYRDNEEGSFFVKAIKDVFCNYACKEQLAELATRITEHVANEELSKSETLRLKQCPEYKSTLRRKVYFFSGEQGIGLHH